MARSNGAGRHDIGRVPEPVAGYAAMPTSVHNTRRELLPVAVVDAYEEVRKVRALARFDLLDRERRSNRLNEASYLVGREIERVLEPMRHVSGGGQWLEGDRIDGASQAELALVIGVDRARNVNFLLAWITRHVGRQDARILWMTLGCGFTFATAAAAFGRGGVRGQRYVADRFSDALSALADAKAAHGRVSHGR